MGRQLQFIHGRANREYTSSTETKDLYPEAKILSEIGAALGDVPGGGRIFHPSLDFRTNHHYFVGISLERAAIVLFVDSGAMVGMMSEQECRDADVP